MPSSSIESYCTFTLASDVTAGGLPSEEDIAKDLESNDNNVRLAMLWLSSIDERNDAKAEKMGDDICNNVLVHLPTRLSLSNRTFSFPFLSLILVSFVLG